jgi:hypothetical protein
MKICLLILLVIPSTVWSWGKIGHRVVGAVAENHLTDLAKLQLKKLLGNEGLPEASVWPDRIKSDPKLRKKYNHWHYLSAKKGKKISQRKKEVAGDILTAIDHFSKVLQNSKSTKNEKVHAVRFLTHFIGDLHQPLHTGYKSDKGGNDIKLKWFGNSTTLHNVWDENIIELEKLSYTEYTKKIDHPTNIQIIEWQDSKPLSWAQESRDYLTKVYKFKEKKYWEYDYAYTHLNYLNDRLLKAGVRLAGHFNKLFK